MWAASAVSSLLPKCVISLCALTQAPPAHYPIACTKPRPQLELSLRSPLRAPGFLLGPSSCTIAHASSPGLWPCARSGHAERILEAMATRAAIISAFSDLRIAGDSCIWVLSRHQKMGDGQGCCAGTQSSVLRRHNGRGCCAGTQVFSEFRKEATLSARPEPRIHTNPLKAH